MTRHLHSVPRKGEWVEITDRRAREAAGVTGNAPFVLKVRSVWWAFTANETIASLHLE
jgi:hypothetical protein